MAEERRQRIVLIGASGHARVVADAVALADQHHLVGVIDREASVGSTVHGHPVLGDQLALARLVASREIDGAIVCIGDNATRRRVAHQAVAAAPGLIFLAVVHPFTAVAKGATIGAGAFIAPGAVIAPGARVGAHGLVNTGASLDHDSVLEEGASLAPGVTVGGNVTIGTMSAISIGASIAHGVVIGAHSVIGAGAVVLADLPDHCVAFGVPAKVIRPRREDERYL